MPMYEFRCTNCRQDFEELVAATATETPPCPACSSPKTEKLMSCCHHSGGSADYGAASSGGGGGCAGCSGGNCASCH